MLDIPCVATPVTSDSSYTVMKTSSSGPATVSPEGQR